MAEPEPRNKLTSVNTLDDVISLIKKSSKIILLTGAGVSYSIKEEPLFKGTLNKGHGTFNLSIKDKFFVPYSNMAMQ